MKPQIPPQMLGYLKGKLLWSLEHWSEGTASKDAALDYILSSLISNTYQNLREIHNNVEGIAKMLRNNPQNTDNILERSIEDLKQEWIDNKSKNMDIFSKITGHHRNIKDIDWKDIGSKTILDDYAEAATAMGSKKWVINGLNWIHEFIVGYFNDDKAVEYSRRSAFKRNRDGFPVDSNSSIAINLPSKRCTRLIDLIDIGSCYNPFSKYPEYSITAVDLCPSAPNLGVRRCDFLQVEICSNINLSSLDQSDLQEGKSGDEDGSVVQLPIQSYDAAVFSLVLSYLPCPKQRVTMIRKARQILRQSAKNDYPGILLIYEKESIFGAHEKFPILLRHWKNAIANQGFELIKYQRLACDHRIGHVFAFRVTSEANHENVISDVGSASDNQDI